MRAPRFIKVEDKPRLYKVKGKWTCVSVRSDEFIYGTAFNPFTAYDAHNREVIRRGYKLYSPKKKSLLSRILNIQLGIGP